MTTDQENERPKSVGPPEIRIRVGLIDDHALFRKGLASILKAFADMQLVLEATDGKHLVEQLAPPSERQVDVVLLDLEMPRLDGLATTRWLRQHRPETRIIALSMHGDESLILSLVEEGIAGYLFKNAEPEEVALAVREVWAAGQYFTPEVRGVIAAYLTGKAQVRRRRPLLSADQQDVLRLVVQGLTSAEIGARLCVPVRTVEGRRQKILDKLGAKSTADLIKIALQQKLI